MSYDRLSSTTAMASSAALPIFTGLLGTMGIASGLYGLTAPADADNVFGLVAPRSVSASKDLQAWQRAQAYARGIRVFVGGVSIVGMTAFWQFSSMCQASPLAALAAKRSLGIVFLTGTVIAAGDGLIVGQFVQSQGAATSSASEEDKEAGKKASLGHLIMAAPILAIGLSCFLT